MIHDTNFNKILFIDCSKVFIMPKHVFYDLSSMQLQCPTWLKKQFKMFLATSNQLYDSCN